MAAFNPNENWSTKILTPTVNGKLCRKCNKKIKIKKTKQVYHKNGYCSHECCSAQLSNCKHLISIENCWKFICDYEDYGYYYKIIDKYERWMKKYPKIEAQEATNFINNWRKRSYNIAINGRIESNHTIRSGCSSVTALLALLCCNNTMIKGEYLIMIYLIYCNLHKSIVRSGCFDMSPIHTYHNMFYYCPTRDLIINETFVNNFAYIFSLTPTNRDLGKIGLDNDNYFTWEFQTSKPIKSDHTLMIVYINGKGMIVQSYYGHYKYSGWSAFKNELTQMPIDQYPIMKGWHRQIQKSPKYRGFLTKDQMKYLLHDIRKLTLENNHIGTYADITGIIHTDETIAKKYYVLAARLNLDMLAHL